MNEWSRENKSGQRPKMVAIRARYYRVPGWVFNNGVRNGFRKHRSTLAFGNGYRYDGATFRFEARQTNREIMGTFLALYVFVWFWSVIAAIALQGMGVL